MTRQKGSDTGQSNKGGVKDPEVWVKYRRSCKKNFPSCSCIDTKEGKPWHRRKTSSQHETHKS